MHSGAPRGFRGLQRAPRGSGHRCSQELRGSRGLPGPPWGSWGLRGFQNPARTQELPGPPRTSEGPRGSRGRGFQVLRGTAKGSGAVRGCQGLRGFQGLPGGQGLPTGQGPPGSRGPQEFTGSLRGPPRVSQELRAPQALPRPQGLPGSQGLPRNLPRNQLDVMPKFCVGAQLEQFLLCVTPSPPSPLFLFWGRTSSGGGDRGPHTFLKSPQCITAFEQHPQLSTHET